MMRDGDRMASVVTDDGVLADVHHPRRVLQPGGDPRRAPAARGPVGTASCRPRARARSLLTATPRPARPTSKNSGRARDGRQGLTYAIYHDRYQRTGDAWKFTERVFEVGFLDTSPLAGSAPV